MARVSSSRNPEYADMRRAQLRAATLRAIARKGVGAVRMRDIAEEADMSPGIVNYYFESREGAIAEAFELMSRALGRSVEEKVQENSDNRETLIFAGTALFQAESVQGVSTTSEIARLALEWWTAATTSDLVLRTLQETYSAMDERIAAVIARGQSAGEIEPNLNPVIEAGLYRSMIAGQVLEFFLSSSGADEERVFEKIARAIGDYVDGRLYQRP